MIFRPSDACFDDENRNYYALDGSWHRYSQDCFQANVKWLNEEIPKDPQDYIKELEAENKQLRRERDKAVEELHRNTDAVPVVRCKDCVYKACLLYTSYVKSGTDRQVDFIDVVVWRQTAEFVCKYFHKGQLAAVQGSIQTRSYTDKDGNKRKAFEIVAESVHFAEPKKDKSNEPIVTIPGNDTFEEIISDDDLPFN